MQWRNTRERFGAVAASLHWVIAAGIVAQYFLAEAGEDAGAGVLDAMALHRSIGIALLALALVRLFWRIAQPRPVWPGSMKPYEILLARAVHTAFYALLFAIPLSGWALSSLEGESLSIFGLFSMPALPTGAASESLIEEVHEVLFNLLLALVILHAAAALKHQFVDHDGVLKSMLPR
jgi:cytochrome b561